MSIAKNTRATLSLGLSALVLGGSMVGCSATSGGVASMGSRVTAATAKLAARNADKATKALAKGDAAGAVGFAEAAVTGAPEDAGYRVLLGQSYLKAGRFESARATFAEALTLTPDNGKAALNLALAETATGDWAAARSTLERYAGVIPVDDRGLALALAGDPAGAVALLTAAARSPQATVTTRQNLALALALGGQWGMAKVIAAADLSPADVDRRMAEWAAFASPAAASDQVAALLGVTPAADAGQPVALALNAPVAPTGVAEVEVAVANVEATPVAVVQAPVEGAPVIVSGGVRFAARAEVVQALPVEPIEVVESEVAAARSPVVRKALPARFVTPAKGDWYVQLGAYDSIAVARDAWSRAQRRFAGLRAQVPAGMVFASGEQQFYRLSVGGFARGDAVRLCERYRTRGGSCFVRAGEGDQVAHWLRRPGVQFASR